MRRPQPCRTYEGKGLIIPRPQRIQRKRTRGWRMPEGAVYVGRPTRWGNPFVTGSRVSIAGVQHDGLVFDCFEITLTAENAVDAYRDVMDVRLTDSDSEHPDDVAWVQEWRQALQTLRGRDLACWCPLSAPCHADVLLELANQEPTR